MIRVISIARGADISNKIARVMYVRIITKHLPQINLFLTQIAHEM